MIRGQSLVCFAPDPWSDIWRNRHRLLSIFARSNRVVYVEPRTTVRGLLRGLRGGAFKSLSPFRPRVEEVRENLFVYHDPGFLPRTVKRGLGPVVDRARNALFTRALHRLGVANPIVWLVRPDGWDLPGTLHEKMLFYQVVDDYTSYPGVTERARARIDSQERSIASRSDFVVVTADHLLDIKRHLHRNLIHVRNAVDETTLEEGRKLEGPILPELRAARRPVWGYIGGITEKLDLVLLEKLATRLEERGGTLALVGPVNVASGAPMQAIERLRRSPAVLFTGQKPVDAVPFALRGFDVGLIPYKVGEQSRAIDPLKLYEYLAFGKPIVAVDIPSLRAFPGVLRVASSHDEFIRLLGEASIDRDESIANQRRDLAAENSWERRAEQLSQAIEAALRSKNAPVETC